MNSSTLDNPATSKRIRVGSKLGKYRIERRVGSGAYADVFAAADTLLGIKVALKIPIEPVMNSELLDEFRREVRLTMKLDHPNILPIRDASVMEGRLVIVTPLATKTLEDRLCHRMSFERSFDFLLQSLAAVAHAHEYGVIHCDIKPANILLFADNHLRLGDFGIAKAARRTIEGAGTGTVGHMSPEQALGKPSMRSDVFALGLLGFRMLAGVWPEYPFAWPMKGITNMRRRAHPELVSILRKSIEVNPRHRFRDAIKMLEAVEAVELKAMRYAKRHREG